MNDENALLRVSNQMSNVCAILRIAKREEVDNIVFTWNLRLRASVETTGPLLERPRFPGMKQASRRMSVFVTSSGRAAITSTRDRSFLEQRQVTASQNYHDLPKCKLKPRELFCRWNIRLVSVMFFFLNESERKSTNHVLPLWIFNSSFLVRFVARYLIRKKKINSCNTGWLAV